MSNDRTKNFQQVNSPETKDTIIINIKNLIFISFYIHIYEGKQFTLFCLYLFIYLFQNKFY